MNTATNNPILKVVLDTNVIVSALNFSGFPSRVLGLAARGNIRNVISTHILNEVERILHDKFSWGLLEAQAAANWLKLISKQVHPKTRFHIIFDEADNRVLECAREGNADFIVSGDHHLTDLKTFQGTQIVTPADFLSAFAAQHKT